MKTSIVTLLITFCFYLSVYAQAPQDKATELKEQALSSLKQKDYIKARYLFKKAYEAFAVRENYPQAIECGIQANALYVRENFYKEGFELCRNMEQLIWTGEQKQNKVFYDLRFPISKERLQMYISLKNPAQAKNQLDKLEEIASLAKNDSLMEVLLYTKANYYYTFNQNTQGDACFRKLISQYKEKKDYDKVSDCYKTLIGIARKANNAPLMERTYESYIVWTDSVKALTAQDELNVLKRKYDESLQTIQDKDSTLSAKQYIIIGLCTLVAILVATIIVLAILLLKFITGNRKLKKSVVIANEHNELKTKFIRNISSQMEPTLNTLGTSAPKLQVKTNKEQLERILLYLLKNAAFYTEQGRISLDFKKRGAHTHQFIITDTGTGIPAEQQENLFKPFTQVKDLTTGDGLGLPICSLIATKMNGSLTLDTSYTKGCRFILELHA